MKEEKPMFVKDHINEFIIDEILDANAIFEAGYHDNPNETKEEYVERHYNKIIRFATGKDKRKNLVTGKYDTIDMITSDKKEKVKEKEWTINREDAKNLVNKSLELAYIMVDKYKDHKIFSHILRVMRSLDNEDKLKYLNMIQSLVVQDKERPYIGLETSGVGLILPFVYNNVINKEGALMDKYLKLAIAKNKVKDNKERSNGRETRKDENQIISRVKSIFNEKIKNDLDTLINKTKKIVSKPEYPLTDIDKINYQEFFGDKKYSSKLLFNALQTEGFIEKNRVKRPGYQVEIDKLFKGDYPLIKRMEWKSNRHTNNGAVIIELYVGGVQQEIIHLKFEKGIPFRERLRYLNNKIQEIEEGRSSTDITQTGKCYRMLEDR
ncbi:MAG: hypothetical protein B6U88_02775 [Candidatus Aenigmarchaeota archaeon ex4484_56]|nr:MAG: hypothetical protein B6U88_02775 [Candidatus Aenigmarchaeota archaeon ex4484_56]